MVVVDGAKPRRLRITGGVGGTSLPINNTKLTNAVNTLC